MTLPTARPEDRRRPEADACVAPPCYRSEAFAEDLADTADPAVAAPARASRWQLFTRRRAVAAPVGLPLPRLRGA